MIADQQKDIFISYTNKLPISEYVKEYILEEKFLSETPLFYLYYPQLFSESFQLGNNKKIPLLSIAGFFYYISIIFTDRLYDEGIQSLSNKILLPVAISTCQEECVKILTDIFGVSSNFWVLWNLRKKEYLEAVYLEKKHKGDIKKEDYEQLADYKSAFGKVAIDACHILSKKAFPEVYNRLLISHKFFSIGFQLSDDIEDFKLDFKYKQINFAHQALKDKLNERNKQFTSYDISMLQKYLYILGIADDLYNYSLASYDSALKILQPKEAQLWRDTINIKKAEAKNILLEIGFYLREATIKAKLSNVKLNYSFNKGLDFKLERSLELGKQFIVNNQKEEGSWEDYNNNAGLSNVWIAGYVLSQISEHMKLFDDNIIKEKCVTFLKVSKKNLWHLSDKWLLEDADSSTFALLALKENSEDIEESLKEWKKYQQKDGGIATYIEPKALVKALNDSKIVDVSGWTQAHVCVSSAALYLLAKTGDRSEVFLKLKSFLLHNQQTNGLWDSYWWTSSLYSTSFVIQSAAILNDQSFSEAVKKCFSSIVAMQNTDGSFGDEFNREMPFYTALVVKAMCASPEYYFNYTDVVEKAVNWLLQNQYEDGSWEASAAMRIPATHVVDTKCIVEWKQKNKGDNIRLKDFHRLLTTSTVLPALYKYMELKTTFIK